MVHGHNCSVEQLGMDRLGPFLHVCLLTSLSSEWSAIKWYAFLMACLPSICLLSYKVSLRLCTSCYGHQCSKSSTMSGSCSYRGYNPVSARSPKLAAQIFVPNWVDKDSMAQTCPPRKRVLHRSFQQLAILLCTQGPHKIYFATSHPSQLSIHT